MKQALSTLLTSKSKKIIVLGLLLFLVIINLIQELSLKKTIDNVPHPTPNPTPYQFLSSEEYKKYRLLSLGKTSDNTLQSLPGFKAKAPLNETKTQYSYMSPLLSRDNLVVAENDSIIFKKTVPLTNTYDHPKISEYLAQYGTPEKVVSGSKYWGEFAKTYIYASKGIAFIGNPVTDEIDEIHEFQPMTVAEYEQIYGQDLNPNTSVEKEINDPRYESVRKLQFVLPFFGTNFAIHYNADENKTLVFIKAARKTEGEVEFNAFLEKYGVTDRSWLPNLSIEYR